LRPPHDRGTDPLWWALDVDRDAVTTVRGSDAGCGYRCAVIERTVSYALLKAMKSSGAISSVLAEHGLHPGQDLLLSALLREDGIAQTVLAARLGIEAPTVSRAL
jgi:hypothetical protein